MILDIGLGWLDRAIVWGGVFPHPELEEMSDSPACAYFEP